MLVKFILALVLIGAGILILLSLWYIKDLPNPERILARGFAQSTKMYDRTGKTLLYQIGEERRSVIALEELPSHVRWATLVAEDADFYKHPGIDITGILRAAWNDIRKRRLAQGGSTITQQFVKNALLSSEKTFSRKLREIILAIWLESRYTKNEIFGFYLNQIPYGQNAYGIAEASLSYFGKSAKDLSIAEAATLAALPLRPSYLSPYGEHKDELFARKNLIIDRMVKEGYITSAQGEEEKAKRLAFSQAADTPRSFIAPHFVIYVKEYLEEKYGSEVVERGGLEVITSLDTRLQKKAEEAVTEVAKKNEKQYRAKNAALAAIDPRTGQILAMVGSRDWFDDSVDGKVNVALRLRQPGSSFKPIVYAKLFEKGFGPESLIFDLQTTFTTRAGKPYTPTNFDGRSHGLLTIRQALAQSRNVPGVKALYLTGIDEVIALAKKMGISSINPGRVDLALVLGGAEVRLLDFTSAYGVFAANGIYNPPQAILRVKTREGEVLEEYEQKPQKVLSPEITGLITSILSDNESRTPVFGPQSPLVIPGIEAAAKTGTTTDFRDGWTLGYTPNLVVGVWAGNNDNSPTYKGEGAFIAGPIWNRLVRFAATTYPSEFGGSFGKPPTHKLLDKPMINGSLVYERKVKTNPIEETSTKEIHSLLYYARPNDPQLDAWEKPVQEWVRARPDAALYSQPLPGKPSNTPPSPDIPPSQPSQPRLRLLNLQDGQKIGDVFGLEFLFESQAPLKQVDVFLDDQLLKTEVQSPVELNLSSFLQGDHLLTIRAFDQTLNSDTKEIYIILDKRQTTDD
ncbi:MAG: transglycosylase domain-containing protein [Candidatus Colwellbacteria bacterium]|nr:transglycosylase domain-containing protein [Candidatus Colwellbacteria bacterium]